MRTHKGTELLANTLKSTQPVVLGKSVEEVLQDVALVSAASELLQLGNDLLLVGGGEGRGADDGGELAVVLESLAEGGEGLRDLVEGGGFGGGSVLFRYRVSGCCVNFGDAIGFSEFFKGRINGGLQLQSQSSGISSDRMQEEKESYQSSGIGTVNTEEGHGGPDFLGRGSVGPQAVDGGSARDGELLGRGTQASAGESSGKHDDGRVNCTERNEPRRRGSEEKDRMGKARSEGKRCNGAAVMKRRPTSPDPVT